MHCTLDLIKMLTSMQHVKEEGMSLLKHAADAANGTKVG